jgi:hypothetical protein
MRRMLFLAPLVLALAACGGSSGTAGGGNVAAGPAGDPVAAVNNLINAMKAKAFDKIGPLVCAAKRYEIAGALTGGLTGGLADAMGFDFKDMKVNQTSINGDSAVVHVEGNMVLTLDAAKGKDAVRKMLQDAAPSGQTVTDEQVNQVVSGFGTGNTTPIKSDMQVVKENGGWVVCSDLNTSGG